MHMLTESEILQSTGKWYKLYDRQFLYFHLQKEKQFTDFNFEYGNNWRIFNPFSPNQLSTPNFFLHIIYKIRHLVIRKWDLIKHSKLLKIKSKTLSNLFNEKYRLKLDEFNNTTETERVNN